MAESLLLEGNCLDVLKDIPDNSVDSIVTDPPYGLSFMGKKWDYDVPTTAIWAECLRVLKPGGHLLAFFGTRTYHRGVVRIEDAGFEIRDQIMWLYGSGFPKSHDVSKGIDKQAGAEREVVGLKDTKGRVKAEGWGMTDSSTENITAPATEEAKQWSGWGTALKPANEPIVVARKPLEKGLTIAENVVKWGTGALNIDASRIAGEPWKAHTATGLGSVKFFTEGENKEIEKAPHAQGRWPANVLLDEEAAAALDLQSGITPSNARKNKGEFSGYGSDKLDSRPQYQLSDNSGGASRFFYVAKASKRERGADNAHPTVKPIKLMEYLIQLITPVNGSVLDPFMGSGSTGVAAKNLNRDFIGIEMSPEYFEIAQKRVG